MSSFTLHLQDYVTPEQFAELSTLSIATVRRYLRTGKLPHEQPFGPRGRVLIPRNALQPFVGQCAAAVDTDSAIDALPSSSVSNVARAPGPSPRWKKPRGPKEGA